MPFHASSARSRPRYVGSGKPKAVGPPCCYFGGWVVGVCWKRGKSRYTDDEGSPTRTVGEVLWWIPFQVMTLLRPVVMDLMIECRKKGRTAGPSPGRAESIISPAYVPTVKVSFWSKARWSRPNSSRPVLSQSWWMEGKKEITWAVWMDACTAPTQTKHAPSGESGR